MLLLLQQQQEDTTTAVSDATSYHTAQQQQSPTYYYNYVEEPSSLFLSCDDSLEEQQITAAAAAVERSTRTPTPPQLPLLSDRVLLLDDHNTTLTTEIDQAIQSIDAMRTNTHRLIQRVEQSHIGTATEATVAPSSMRNKNEDISRSRTSTSTSTTAPDRAQQREADDVLNPDKEVAEVLEFVDALRRSESSRSPPPAAALQQQATKTQHGLHYHHSETQVQDATQSVDTLRSHNHRLQQQVRQAEDLCAAIQQQHRTTATQLAELHATYATACRQRDQGAALQATLHRNLRTTKAQWTAAHQAHRALLRRLDATMMMMMMVDDDEDEDAENRDVRIVYDSSSSTMHEHLHSFVRSFLYHTISTTVLFLLFEQPSLPPPSLPEQERLVEHKIATAIADLKATIARLDDQLEQSQQEWSQAMHVRGYIIHVYTTSVVWVCLCSPSFLPSSGVCRPRARQNVVARNPTRTFGFSKKRISSCYWN